MSWPGIIDGPFASDPGSGRNQANVITYVQGRTGASMPTLPDDSDFDLIAGSSSAVPLVSTGVLTASATTDMRYRFYQVPADIRLVNPPANTDLTYVLWNTWPENQTLNTQVVSDPAILTSGLSVTDVINANSYFAATYQIADTTTDISESITLGFDDETIVVRFFGSVASTFAIIPDVPVTEEWRFETDVIRSFDNTEQRFSLMPNPRRRLRFGVNVMDDEQRRRQYITLFRNMGQAAIVPEFMHSTKLKATTPAGTNQLFFDPELTVLASGRTVVVLNPQTEEFEIATVLNMNVDGANLAGNLSITVDTSWVVLPAMSYLLDTSSAINTQSVTSQLRVSGEGLEFPSILRENANVTLTRIGGLPIMEKKLTAGGMTESFSRRVETIDHGTGIIEVERFADEHSVVSGRKRWVIDRYDRESEDYMRAFINDVRGAQKAFYLPTWLPDMKLAETPATGAGTLSVTTQDYETFFAQFPTWRYVMLQYRTLPPTFHEVLESTGEEDGGLTITIDPPLEPSSVPATDITAISYLNRVRGDDRIQRRHGLKTTAYSWFTRTVDE